MTSQACFVDVCPNTRENCSAKLFLTVPQRIEVRQLWWKVANGHTSKMPKISNSNTNMVCCEDHFDLENDSSNWMYFKMMGGAIKLKEGVVPSRYIKEAPKTPLPPLLSDSARLQQEQNYRKQTVERYNKNLKVTQQDIIPVTITDDPKSSITFDEDVVYVPPGSPVPVICTLKDRKSAQSKRNVEDAESQDVGSSKKLKNTEVPGTVDSEADDVPIDILIQMYTELTKIPVPQCKCVHATNVKRRYQPRKDIIRTQSLLIEPKKDIIKPQSSVIEPKKDIKPQSSVIEPRKDAITPQSSVIEIE